jgi:SAM-dependent methyltransferase
VTSRRIPRTVRSSVFGRNPEAYHRARLGYPKRVYEILTTRCGLAPGAAVFEVGPGTGLASRELLRFGANPLLLVEPDRRLARYLAGALHPALDRVRFVSERFERARLDAGAFDLGVAASSFHWTPERRALRKVARALRSGGWWAMWNNHHGDPYRPSAFHRALQPLYEELSGQRHRTIGMSPKKTRRMHHRERLAAFRSVGSFDRISREDVRWNVVLTTARTQALWGTFSDVLVLPARTRRWFLAELGRVSDEQFGGKVRIPMLTPIYTARRV